MIDELVELVAMCNAGAWSRGDFLYQITLLVPQVSVESIVDQRPGPLREEFVSWLRETYDNDAPADAFVSIGRQDDPAQKQLRLEALRAWLLTGSNDKHLVNLVADKSRMERVTMIEFKGIDLVFQCLTDHASLRRALAASLHFPEDRVSVIDDMSVYPDRATADVVAVATPLTANYSTMVSIQNESIELSYDSSLSLAQHICDLLDTQCLTHDEGTDPYLMWLVSPRAPARRVVLDPVALDDGRYVIDHRSDSPL